MLSSLCLFNDCNTNEQCKLFLFLRLRILCTFQYVDINFNPPKTFRFHQPTRDNPNRGPTSIKSKLHYHYIWLAYLTKNFKRSTHLDAIVFCNAHTLSIFHRLITHSEVHIVGLSRWNSWWGRCISVNNDILISFIFWCFW